MRNGRQQTLWHSQRGAAAIEFAFAIPVLVLTLMILAQLGLLYFAHAGLEHKVGEAARFATLYPRRSNAEILQKIDASGLPCAAG